MFKIGSDHLRKGKKHVPLSKLFPEYKKIITCMAPSKTFNTAGLMLSNIIIPDNDLRKTWLSRHYNFDHPLSVAGAQAAYEKGADWLEALRVYLDANFEYMKCYLSWRRD